MVLQRNRREICWLNPHTNIVFLRMLQLETELWRWNYHIQRYFALNGCRISQLLKK